MIETGGPFLRSGENPKKRKQDGLKHKLLCKDCELLASVTEKNFAERVFRPSIERGAIPRKLGREEYEFLCHVHFRVLSSYLLRKGTSALTAEQVSLVEKTLANIRIFLAGGRRSASPARLFLIPFGLGQTSDLSGMPSNWHRFIRRATEMDLIYSDPGALFGSYFKVGPWVSFLVIKNTGQPWSGSEVTVNRRKTANERSVLPPYILEFLQDRAANAQKALRSLPNHQKEKIAATFEATLDEEKYGEMYDAIIADNLEFGESAFDSCTVSKDPRGGAPGL